LKEFIGAADIYITPYLNESQITSGALTYSFGAGKAVRSCSHGCCAQRAWKPGRGMIWSVVAIRHMEASSKLEHASTKGVRNSNLDNRPYELPPLKLDHVVRMTDNTGIFQHAIFNVPNFAEGYCIDDNARALILTLLLEESASLVTRLQFEHTWPAFS
jgi:hypothetical protein